jgi:glutathione S-transferase
VIKLYDSPQSPFCRRVRIALAEKGLEYEKIPVDLGKKENREPAYLKMNPYGKVPVLADGGVILYESAIINEYLDEKYPNPPLMPKDPQLRARVRILVDYCDQHFGGPLRTIRLELQKPESERDQKVIQQAEGEVRRNLQWLNGEIAGKEFLVGPFSLADVCFMPRVGTLEQIGFKVDPSLESLNRWIGHVKRRTSFQA